jgi:hypothetical protein
VTQFARSNAVSDRRTGTQRLLSPGIASLAKSIATTIVLSLLATPLLAQRVEIPTPVQPVQYGGPSPYSAIPSTPAPTLTTTPTYSAPAVGPPPAFDPYAVGGSVSAPPPPAMPYTYTPPATAAPFGTSAPAAPYGAPTAVAPYGQPLSPPPLTQTNPFQYQPAPYDVTPAGEGYWQKTQRFMQQIGAEYTFLYGRQSNPNDFGVNRLELSATFAFPMMYDIQTPLLVTPGFAFNWLQGPLSSAPGDPDLPPRVYDAYLDLAWFPHPYDWLGLELGFRPGIFTDFNHVDSDSLRLMGRGAADIAIAPDMDVVLGAAYLDRVDVKILPVIGIYYRPSPDWDVYAVFPNPKIRKFLASVGTTKWWGYAAGEYGGGSWTVSRDQGPDRVDYNDIRVIGGLEFETQSQVRGHIEVGFVFNREIVFDSQDPPDFKPSDTVMLRTGVNF